MASWSTFRLSCFFLLHILSLGCSGLVVGTIAGDWLEKTCLQSYL